MAARNESGADRKRGKERSRSSKSSGRPWNVEAERGDGRTGRVGMVSLSNDRMSERGSEEAFDLPAWREPPAPDRTRLMFFGWALTTE